MRRVVGYEKSLLAEDDGGWMDGDAMQLQCGVCLVVKVSGALSG